TFRDISNHQEMFQKCEELCEALEADVKKADVKGMTVTLKIKTAAFELHTRSKTLFYPVGCKSEIYPVISDLLKQELAANKGQMKLRLIGVGLSKLSNAGKDSQQKSLDYFIQKVKAKKKSQDTDTLASSIKNSEYHPDSSLTSSAVTSSECESIQTTDLEDGGQREIVNGANASTTSSNEEPSEHILNPCNDAADKEINCPICEKEFNDLCALNKHLDECGITQNNEIGILEKQDKIEDNSVNNNDLTQQITCFTCPLCNATFCCQDITLEKFNTHVDSCLNRKTIMELVKSESNYANSDSEKTKTKRSSKTSGPPRKRQKTTSKPSCTIDNFFKK
uniref:DNA polymerase kappa-like n=1 Tax=Styela clava TaxID=7725 RepID=UPI001939B725